MAKQKKKAAAFAVPQSMTEANDYVKRIGRAQRDRDHLEIVMNDELAMIKTTYEEKAAPYKSMIEDLTNGLHVYCAANREELTKGGKSKTYKFPAGEINWRRRPPKVTIKGAEAVIKRLLAGGLKQFLRQKITINKEAMLADPKAAEAVEGVSIGSDGEDFVITPFETELEEVAK